MNKNMPTGGRAPLKPSPAKAGRNSPQLSVEQFKWMAEKIRQLLGITLQPQKHLLVQSRIQRRLRDLDLEDFDAYIKYLQGPKGNEEAVDFCNALTTNLTSFFRERHHFDHLAAEIKGGDLARNGKLTLWSAGCSSGQEPYTIAMTIAGIPNMGGIQDLNFTATDVDTNVLAKAKAGIYEGSDVAGVPPEYKRNFSPTGTRGQMQISPKLRKMINFRPGNLMKDWPAPGSCDVIFCRNVLIYFDPDTKAGIINNFAKSLRKDGVLYLGHSETIMNIECDLEMIGRTTYRRT